MLLETIEIPDDLHWVDEFSYTGVSQNIDRSILGGLIVQEQSMQHGRPVTLVGGPDYAWVTRETVLQLQSMSEVSGQVMQLNLYDGRSFFVIFDRSSSPIESEPISLYKLPTDKKMYSLKLNLMTVEAPL